MTLNSLVRVGIFLKDVGSSLARGCRTGMFGLSLARGCRTGMFGLSLAHCGRTGMFLKDMSSSLALCCITLVADKTPETKYFVKDSVTHQRSNTVGI